MPLHLILWASLRPQPQPHEESYSLWRERMAQWLYQLILFILPR